MILLWFQARIQQKEETIAKYQELLKQARDDMQDMNKRHEQDLKNMQLKIHQNTDSAFNKFKEAARDLMAKQQLRQPATEKQVSGTKLGQWCKNMWGIQTEAQTAHHRETGQWFIQFLSLLPL